MSGGVVQWPEGETHCRNLSFICSYFCASATQSLGCFQALWKLVQFTEDNFVTCVKFLQIFNNLSSYWFWSTGHWLGNFLLRSLSFSFRTLFPFSFVNATGLLFQDNLVEKFRENLSNFGKPTSTDRWPTLWQAKYLQFFCHSRLIPQGQPFRCVLKLYLCNSTSPFEWIRCTL
jgi:hypothetical protein